MKENQNGLPRRRFFKIGIGSIGGIFGISYLGLVGRYLNPPPVGAEPLAEVGKVSDFPTGTPTLVSFKNNSVEQGVYVVNLGDEGWIALDFHCTHLQCAVNWIDATKTFACPCHGGIYDIKGNVKGGPPPRPLEQRKIKIQDDTVMVGGRLA